MNVDANAIPVRSLRRFSGIGYDKGRGVLGQIAWFSVLNLVFKKWWCPPVLRPAILRLFGAKVGRRVLIRHGVRILWPWKISIGEDSWLGEDAWIINLEDVTLGSNVCLSQGARIITGSHDRFSESFEFDNGAVTIGDGVWIAASAIVLRGVVVHSGATISAGCVVHKNVSKNEIVRK